MKDTGLNGAISDIRMMGNEDIGYARSVIAAVLASHCLSLKTGIETSVSTPQALRECAVMLEEIEAREKTLAGEKVS